MRHSRHSAASVAQYSADPNKTTSVARKARKWDALIESGSSDDENIKDNPYYKEGRKSAAPKSSM